MNTVIHPRRTLLLHVAATAVAGVLAFGPFDAWAQSRRVIVNGLWLSDAQVAELVRRNCSDIPDGAYWLNLQNGAWGYAGQPAVRGYLGDACRTAGAGGGAAGRYGPYATMNRANQVANAYRAQGWRAAAFHDGDGYYVDVRR